MPVLVIDAPEALAAKLAEQRALEDEVATLEEQLKDKKALLKNVSENELTELVTPEMTREDTLVRADDRFYTFEQKYHCGIAAADRTAAHLWLEENGHGAMLKRYVVVSLPKDSRTLVAKLKGLIASMLPHFEVEIVVPSAGDSKLKDMIEHVCKLAGVDKPEIETGTELPGATLSSFVKKQLRAGKKLPDTFGVYAPIQASLAEAPALWQDDEGKFWHADTLDGIAAETGPFSSFEEADASLTSVVQERLSAQADVKQA